VTFLLQHISNIGAAAVGKLSIVLCISRSQTDSMTVMLNRRSCGIVSDAYDGSGSRCAPLYIQYLSK